MRKNLSELKIYHNVNYHKKVIIVTGPVASGKTTVAKNCARNMNQPYYFDKDLLTDCTYPIFKIANVEKDRHSTFFSDNIRDAEYKSMNRIVLEGLKYNDNVIINAPYTKELRSIEGKQYEAFREFGEKIHAAGAELFIIYTYVTEDIMYTRVKKRASVSKEAYERDRYILNDPSFCTKHALPAPTFPSDTVVDRLFVFDSADSKKSYEKLKKVLGLSDKFPFDPHIDVNPKIQIIAPRNPELVNNIINAVIDKYKQMETEQQHYNEETDNKSGYKVLDEESASGEKP